MKPKTVRHTGEIEYAIKESKARAARCVKANNQEGFAIAQAIAQALEWALGEENSFGTMVKMLKAVDRMPPEVPEQVQ